MDECQNIISFDELNSIDIDDAIDDNNMVNMKVLIAVLTLTFIQFHLVFAINYANMSFAPLL